MSTARAYWVANWFYQVIFVESVGAIETPELQKLRREAKARFLNSFTLSGTVVNRVW
jgi:hypothetical protein